jgi:tetratricopeptide (TPR) repeat protein
VAFGLGRYGEAAAKYEEAFSLKPDPALLYNAAQSYRLAGNKPRALELYRNCLRLFPDFPNAADARNRIAELKKELEEAPAATKPVVAPATAPPPATTRVATPAPPPLAAVTPPPAPPPAAPPPDAPPPALVATAPAPADGARKDESRGGSKAWLWITIGAVAVAGGIAAVVLATRGTSYPDASFGTANGN